MSPSKNAVHTCLSTLEKGDVVAMSILAGGYSDLNQAFDYIRALPRLSGIAVGVSSKKHAHETFTKFGMLLRPDSGKVAEATETPLPKIE
jgi:hypothetical protein